jgi:hypothetical protein
MTGWSRRSILVELLPFPCAPWETLAHTSDSPERMTARKGSNPSPNHECFRSKTTFPVFFPIQISGQIEMRTKEIARVE